MGFASRLVSLAILALAIGLGLLSRQSSGVGPPPLLYSASNEPSCTSDPTVTISLDDIRSLLDENHSARVSVAVDPCLVYSETYSEARGKFRSAAQKAGWTLHALPIPGIQNDDDSNGAYGGLYTIDIAVLGGTGPGLVVHTSGVHGVEGYAGSAIQIAFVEYMAGMLNKSDSHFPTIVLIHAFNPYGMAHYRRTNENNVDLNRNGLHPDDWNEIITTPTGKYESYGKFDADFFNPQRAPTWWDATVGNWVTLGVALWQNGFDALKKSLVTGQYFNPRGIFYGGGQQAEPSYQLLWEFLERELLQQPHGEGGVDEPEACCRGMVTWIDVHTGLGKSGHDTLMIKLGAEQDADQDILRWFPNAPIPALSKTSQDVVKGYDAATGYAPNFFGRLFLRRDSSPGALFVMQEFGTIPGIFVARALILENMAYHFLQKDVALHWAKYTTRWAFYKQTTAWRRGILERGVAVLLQSIQRSSTPPSSWVLNDSHFYK